MEQNTQKAFYQAAIEERIKRLPLSGLKTLADTASGLQLISTEYHGISRKRIRKETRSQEREKQQLHNLVDTLEKDELSFILVITQKVAEA